MAALQVRGLQGGQSLSTRGTGSLGRARRARCGHACRRYASCTWLLVALACAWLRPSSAAAHGVAPRALAPLLHDDQGVRLVSLTRGLAISSGSGFRYFCPPRWDGSESVPVVALPGGPALLALPSGLFLVGPDGTSTPYPETALGNVLALASASNDAYALALSGERYELRRIRRDASEVLWSAPQQAGLFSALAAGDDTLALLGLRDGVLHQLLLRRDGSELSRAQAEVGADALTVVARVAGSTSYAVVSSESGDRIELGRIEQGRWLSLLQAVGNLSGPVAARDQALFVAVDGALGSFEGEKLTPVRDTAFVTDLASADGELYASVREGLSPLSAGMLGDPVFAFADLAGPRTDELTPPERAACESAWQHLQVDLIAAGLLGVEGPRDAGSPSTVAASTTADARVPSAPDSALDPPASARADAGSSVADAAAPAPSATRAADGCSLAGPRVHASQRAPSGARAVWTAFAAGLLLLRRRRAGARGAGAA